MQLVHWVATEAPLVADQVPATQFWQAPEDEAPVLAEYVPGTQLAQVPDVDAPVAAE